MYEVGMPPLLRSCAISESVDRLVKFCRFMLQSPNRPPLLRELRLTAYAWRLNRGNSPELIKQTIGMLAYVLIGARQTLRVLGIDALQEFVAANGAFFPALRSLEALQVVDFSYSFEMLDSPVTDAALDSSDDRFDDALAVDASFLNTLSGILRSLSLSVDYDEWNILCSLRYPLVESATISSEDWAIRTLMGRRRDGQTEANLTLRGLPLTYWNATLHGSVYSRSTTQSVIGSSELLSTVLDLTAQTTSDELSQRYNRNICD
ncbi:hypothetical protein EUX98_g9013 [Antrodiella citrinella]|uniref:Uncharacterized protein n=1 Tax=Antrodiella citrinella TaxID=2447956 RepID=A0A4S4M000_9APHY|nr:hypothetical protein EUX98_g9013 [Antrodiella citrinella]